VDTGQKRRVKRRGPRTDNGDHADDTDCDDNTEVVPYHDVAGNILVDYCPSSPTTEPLFEEDPRDALNVEWLDAVTGYFYKTDPADPLVVAVMPPPLDDLAAFPLLTIANLDWYEVEALEGMDTDILDDLPQWSNAQKLEEWLAPDGP